MPKNIFFGNDTENALMDLTSSCLPAFFHLRILAFQTLYEDTFSLWLEAFIKKGFKNDLGF